MVGRYPDRRSANSIKLLGHQQKIAPKRTTTQGFHYLDYCFRDVADTANLARHHPR